MLPLVHPTRIHPSGHSGPICRTCPKLLLRHCDGLFPVYRCRRRSCRHFFARVTCYCRCIFKNVARGASMPAVSPLLGASSACAVLAPVKASSASAANFTKGVCNCHLPYHSTAYVVKVSLCLQCKFQVSRQANYFLFALWSDVHLLTLRLLQTAWSFSSQEPSTSKSSKN